jgi:hypothetical protein
MVLGLGAILAFVPILVWALYQVPALHHRWDAATVQGFCVLELFAIPIVIYGLLSSQIFLEFDDEAVRYHGYFRSRQVLIRPRLVVMHYEYRAPPVYYYELWFCRSSGGESLLKIRSYLEIFKKNDIQRFVAALTKEHPIVELDPRLLQRLQQDE